MILLSDLRVNILMYCNLMYFLLLINHLDIRFARRILGPNVIIGVSVNNDEELHLAIENGANYVGMGTVFSTTT